MSYRAYPNTTLNDANISNTNPATLSRIDTLFTIILFFPLHWNTFYFEYRFNLT